MHRRLILFVAIIFTFTTCRKDHDRPQWDIEVLGPILHASLGLGDLIGDSSIEANGSGAQIIAFDTTISNIKLDSLYQVADTTIPFIYQTLFGGNIGPNAPFPLSNNKIELGVGDVLLKQAIISSGKIRLEIKNVLPAKINFNYSIPKAKKNGQSFSVSMSVDSGSHASPKYFSGDFDFSGYDLDLTGPAGNLFNTISYDVVARSDSNSTPFSVSPGDTMIILNTSLIALTPSFVLGYLGQATSNESSIENIGIGGLIKNGTVALDSVQMNLDVINYIGADAQVYINNFTSRNNRTGTSVDLVAPHAIQHYLNINRASRNPLLTDPILPTYYFIQLDKNNSNIKDLIENIPDKLEFNFNFNLNPLGNVSGSNDFVYSDRLVNTRVRINIPLNFAVNQLILADTLPFAISNATNFDPIGPTTLTLVADNGFPIDLNIQMFMVDSSGAITDSIFSPDVINRAPVDAFYRANGITTSKIYIPIDADRKKHLLSAAQIGIRILFNTPDYPQLIQMYSDYRLDLKLIADGIYSIR